MFDCQRCWLLFRPLTVDEPIQRHTDQNGQLSRSVTTVVPQNPFNKMDNTCTTTNGSLDSRSHIVMRDLPRSTSSPSKTAKANENKTEKTENNQMQN